MTDFAAIDFETANGKRTSVCSVGVVVVRGGAVADTFYSLIRPRPNYYSAFTTAVHGLTYHDTVEAPGPGPATGSTAPAVRRGGSSAAGFPTISFIRSRRPADSI